MVSVKYWHRRPWIDERFMRFLSALFVWLSMQAAYADPSADLQQRLNDLAHFQAQFTQQTFDERGRELETLQGQFVWQRPGKLRWEVQQPYAQLIVADGVLLWLYEPDLQQASLRSLDEIVGEGGLFAVLAGIRPLQQDYRVEQVVQGDHTVRYQLQAHEVNPAMRDLVLHFDAEGLQRIEFIDGIGQHQVLAFRERRHEASAAAFVFVPPAGTEVIRSPALVSGD